MKYFKLQNLLNKTDESFYWIGFIMSDGYLSRDKSRLEITLAEKDKEHLEKFNNFIDNEAIIHPHNKGKFKLNRLSIRDLATISKIFTLFKVKTPKTYNPIKLSYILTKKRFFPFICGYIDGDGSIYNINKTGIALDIHNHISHYENFLLIQKYLNKFKIDSKIYKYKKMCQIRICNEKSISNLKKNIEKYNLPLLERKWKLLIS